MKYKHFGKWLKAKLKQHSVLQQDLAKQICVAENTVTSWTTAHREPTIRNYLWICRFIAILEEKELNEVVTETAEYF